MPIKWSVMIDDKPWDAYLAFPEEDAPAVDVPGYDLDVAFGLEALGMDVPVVDLVLEWKQGPSFFLTQKDNLKQFLIRLTYSDGDELKDLEKLLPTERLSGIMRDTVLLLLSAAHGSEEERYPVTLRSFFRLMYDLDFNGTTIRDIEWGDDLLQEVMEYAFEDFNTELWNLAESLYKEERGKPAEIHEGDLTCIEENEVFFSCKQELTLYIFDTDQETWTLRGTWTFTDAELEDWDFELSEDSDSPDDIVQDFLDGIGESNDWEEVLSDNSEAKIGAPFVPRPDGTGDYAVFIDGNFFGRYVHPSDAERFAELSNMASLDMWEATAHQLHPKSEEDNDFDEEDIDNYFEL